MTQHLSAQEREINLYDHDSKPYYFGLTLGLNSTRFHPQMHSRFLQDDSVLTAEPLNSIGLNLGLLATARISDRFQLRFNPQLIFTEKKIRYNLKNPEDGKTEILQSFNPIIVSFPIQIKLQSDRIDNFRVYMFAGMKADIALSGNKKSDGSIQIKSADFGPELGLGFNFFLKSFIFSPEIKISNGIPNIHNRDASVKYSSVFDKIQSRMIMLSFHFEG
ncbi:MAG: outer membrane beta-barrel protein [Chitinophagaceae bacterium]